MKFYKMSLEKEAIVQLKKIQGNMLISKEEPVPQLRQLPGLNRSIQQQLTLNKWTLIKERLKKIFMRV